MLALSLSGSLRAESTPAVGEVGDRTRAILPFDADWRFFKGDAPGAEKPDFDDSSWRTLDVPHDWSIEGPYDENAPTGAGGGFLPAGVGWYRKHFTLPVYGPQARVFVEFDGVMANSDVWINGFHLGQRPNGFVSFRYELSGHLNPTGKPNVLAVRADNSNQPASRFYVGAGIYRHVRLVVVGPLHLEPWGVFVTTSAITPQSADVSVQSTLVNEATSTAPVVVQTTIFGPEGNPVQEVQTARGVSPGKSEVVTQRISVAKPLLWDLDRPNLYRARVRILVGKTVIDDEIVTFGIREFHFDPTTGFWLNGKNLKIKGVCLHADGGAMGAAVPLSVWRRRLEALREVGVNAIRTAHNPPAPEFLDLCDQMGFLVMDEMFDCWTVAKNPADYHLYFKDWSKIDTADIVRRDRNHPSVILYSAGNEIHDTPNATLAKGILRGLVAVFHAEDSTRPVTQALFRPNRSHDYTNGLADMLDVVGQNYRESEILAAQKAKPTRKIIGTENGHDRAVWLALRDNPAYAGQFLWTGIDYLGEARAWPTVANSAGLLDRTGTPRPLAFERQSWWSDRPMVRIARRTAPAVSTEIDPGYDAPAPTVADKHAQRTFADWSPANPKPGGEDVEANSNCEEVELFLNGKSLGSQTLPADAAARKWKVPFAAGSLKAVAKNGGKIVATDELRTAGKPAKVVLTAESTALGTTFDDVRYVKATIVDANGIEVPTASDLVTFSVAGPGGIVAVDNGDNRSHESFQAKERRAFHGHCYAIVRATGTEGPITLTASASDLTSGSISIPTSPP